MSSAPARAISADAVTTGYSGPSSVEVAGAQSTVFCGSPHRSRITQFGQSGLRAFADVAAVQDQPVMRVREFGGHDFISCVLDRRDGLAGREPGAVGDAEDMRVHRDGRLAEGDVEHHIGGLAADAGQRFQRLAVRAAPRRRAARSTAGKRDDVAVPWR